MINLKALDAKLTALKMDSAYNVKQGILHYLKEKNIGALYVCHYTPIFNDGDPCEYGIHGVTMLTPEQVENYQDLLTPEEKEDYIGTEEVDLLQVLRAKAAWDGSSKEYEDLEDFIRDHWDANFKRYILDDCEGETIIKPGEDWVTEYYEHD